MLQPHPWVLASLLVVACRAPGGPSSAELLPAPVAHRSDVVDDYHGTKVADPYRWLETSDSPETRAWIEAENARTRAYLDAIESRSRIRSRLEELWNFERYELPVVRGGRVFFRKNDGLQNQSVLVVADSLAGEARVLFDPNALSSDGTIALTDFEPSEDGRLLLYGLSDGGSDWRTWKVREVDSGQDLADAVTRNKFGGARWAVDGSGFYYLRYDLEDEAQKLQAKNAPPDVCLHRLGTSESEDRVVVPRPIAPGVSQVFGLSDDGRWLLVVRWEARSRNTEVDVLDLAAGASAQGVPLISGFDAQHQPFAVEDGTVYVQTDLDAPRGRIVAIPLANPARSAWRELVGQGELAISEARLIGRRMVLCTLRDATSEVRVHGLDGGLLRKVDLPGLGTAAGFEGRAHDPQTFFLFTSFTTPSTIWSYDVASGASQVFRAPVLRFDPERYVTEQVFYSSRDGTRIPMFLTHRRGLVRDGQNPTLLYGYGGFQISLTPSYSTTNVVWLELGGVLAVPNLRGGGEYGEEWHQAGTKLKKQNVFDDFICAADWLIAYGYTSTPKLAIHGGSNGGLLVGACLTQRPDLFGATLPDVGVLDMLRYHIFTIGWAWAGDYGTSDDPEEFRALVAYSPYHNVERGRSYPATLVTTADHDDRVVPAHSFKFTAALQAAQGGREPILIRVQTRAGHGAGKPTELQIDQAADRLAFLVRELGME
jgi:prolyl oligopeptidase